jgi:hypothetical protein
MPLHDKAMYERVLASMREVVLLFEQSSRGDERTIVEIQTGY